MQHVKLGSRRRNKQLRDRKVHHSIRLSLQGAYLRAMVCLTRDRLRQRRFQFENNPRKQESFHKDQQIPRYDSQKASADDQWRAPEAEYLKQQNLALW